MQFGSFMISLKALSAYATYIQPGDVASVTILVKNVTSSGKVRQVQPQPHVIDRVKPHRFQIHEEVHKSCQANLGPISSDHRPFA